MIHKNLFTKSKKLSLYLCFKIINIICKLFKKNYLNAFFIGFSNEKNFSENINLRYSKYIFDLFIYNANNFIYHIKNIF